MAASREELTEAVRTAAENGRLSCEAAHALGRELGVSLREVGAVCNELKIRITACQLGCF
jgi:plasmid stability protein